MFASGDMYNQIRRNGMFSNTMNGNWCSCLFHYFDKGPGIKISNVRITTNFLESLSLTNFVQGPEALISAPVVTQQARHN